VMDKIIALVRVSRFVVADFTWNRGGVYYEAGFASGLGLPVIQICEESQLSSSDPSVRLHFDVTHLNFIGWNEDKLAEFSDRLENRIVAVLGRGPLNRQLT